MKNTKKIWANTAEFPKFNNYIMNAKDSKIVDNIGINYAQNDRYTDKIFAELRSDFIDKLYYCINTEVY